MLKITPALIDAFIKNLTEQEYSPATISKYAHDARALMEYAPDGITDKGQLVGFRSWLERRGYSGASVNSMLGAVNCFLAFLGSDWRLKYVRVQRRAFLPADRELSRQEYKRLVSAALNRGDRRRDRERPCRRARGRNISLAKHRENVYSVLILAGWHNILILCNLVERA